MGLGLWDLPPAAPLPGVPLSCLASMGIYTISSPGSQAFKVRGNYTTAFPGSPAYRQQIM